VTTISYEIAVTGSVSLDVFDALGRRVETLVDGMQTAGSHRVVFDGSGKASGVYFVRLREGGTEDVRKMVMIK
jgi:hypothetical protein